MHSLDAAIFRLITLRKIRDYKASTRSVIALLASLAFTKALNYIIWSGSQPSILSTSRSFEPLNSIQNSFQNAKIYNIISTYFLKYTCSKYVCLKCACFKRAFLLNFLKWTFSNGFSQTNLFNAPLNTFKKFTSSFSSLCPVFFACDASKGNRTVSFLVLF